jgi:hypothetical protein
MTHGLRYGLTQLWIKMYSTTMQQAFKSVPVPLDFKAHIVDYDAFLVIRFYESQWRHYTDAERFKCIQYMMNVKAALEKCGARVAIDPVLDLETPQDRLNRKRRK